MQTIKLYLVDQIAEVQIMDPAIFTVRNRTVYSRPIKVYQGVDNPIQVVVKNQDQMTWLEVLNTRHGDDGVGNVAAAHRTGKLLLVRRIIKRLHPTLDPGQSALRAIRAMCLRLSIKIFLAPQGAVDVSHVIVVHER